MTAPEEGREEGTGEEDGVVLVDMEKKKKKKKQRKEEDEMEVVEEDKGERLVTNLWDFRVAYLCFESLIAQD